MLEGVAIGATGAGDGPALEALYRAAFPAEDLLPLVRRLLEEEPGLVSLAARSGRELAGHVLLTPSGVGDRPNVAALLGPLAVAPARQRQGIGRALVAEGLRRARGRGLRKVLVLGDPAWYGRLGFRPERRVAPPYPLPEAWRDAWQSLDLEPRAPALAGPLRPPPAWQEPGLWSP
jgi:putative acetyltransferase